MDDDDLRPDMNARVEHVLQRRAEACARAGRSIEDVGLVAVSKKFPPESVHEAYQAGLSVFGESRVQEALQKIPDCPGRIDWHFVGRLQSNKVRPVVATFSMIHAVDSSILLERVDALADEEGQAVEVCLQINVSGEASKGGVSPDEALPIVELAQSLKRARLVGLMTLPTFTPDPEDTRPYFRTLRELRDSLEDKTGAHLPHLSMGMSHDFEIAIEEGATWIRVGTAIFGKRFIRTHDE